MAKAKKNFKLSRTINGITYVDSKAYQPHIRAKRGTYTPISLANGMKTSAVEQSRANLMAKIVFDAVHNFAPNFKDGKFWSRLVSVFRQLIKERDDNGYTLLQGMDVRPDYAMSKHGSFVLNHKHDNIQLKYRFMVDSPFRLSILRIATDQSMLIPYPEEVISREIGQEEARFNFSPLPDGTQVLYVLKCEQLVEGKIQGLLSQKSVSFLRVS